MKNGRDKDKRVFVAMSGGVDSSVSVALLKQAGFDVTGVYMKQWSPKVLGQECIWKEERQDAMKVANQLGIKFLTWDFSKEYEKEVGKYMIDSYKKGITPNPDVMCNKIIKFGLFYDKAIKEGADFIATGHYAQTSLGNQIFSRSALNFLLDTRPASAGLTLVTGKIFPPSGKPSNFAPEKQAENKMLRLLKSTDKNKDQTYFLYTLKQKQLNKILFPIGGLTKPEVRELAKKFKLHVAEKKDSQGVCFIGPLNMRNFLKSYIKPKKGKILLLDGKFVGEHDGIYYYTIGQRHGLDIKNGKGPYFVVKKDIKKNIIYVGSEKDLYSKKVKIKNISWIQKPEKFQVLLDV
ncbi:MAG: tRNA 2-thiouridine(34) synthase MnmA, partial [Candidatus Staskawiczbacteria bacterium]|nr:tRNA 2-thiouridine(34) synthase MnmA [Candidatus Staskawiczbacteria bacterium]